MLAHSRRRTTLSAAGLPMRSASGFGLINCLIAVAVVLIITGTLASVALAGQQHVKQLATVELCRQVETAECAYTLQVGAPTAELSTLVSAGYLHGLPQYAGAGHIRIAVTDQGGFQVLCDGHVMLSRRL